MERYSVAVIGATGLVGRALIKVLEERQFPIRKLFLVASKKSVGQKLKYMNKEIPIVALDDFDFQDIDISFFCVNKELSSQFVPKALKSKSIVIDNSSFYRMDDNIPLVAYGVNNFDAIDQKLIANPNCSTIQCMEILKILKDNFGLKRVNYTTYQSVSGSGQKGIKELLSNSSEFYPLPIKYTCIPCIGSLGDNGYTDEEWKMILETKKILKDEGLQVSATCIRVPVLYCHGVVISFTLEKETTVEEVSRKLNQSQRLIILDNIKKNMMPNSIQSYNNDYIYVGRIRKELDDGKSFILYCNSDNLRVGAASNAVSIAEYIIYHF